MLINPRQKKDIPYSYIKRSIKFVLLYQLLKCVYQRTSLTAEPIRFFTTVMHHIGPGEDFNYFWTPPTLQKEIAPSFP